MSVRYQFFTIPVRGGDDAAAELNRFVAMHRVIALDRHFLADGGNSAWAICVSFDDGADPVSRGAGGVARRGKVDFRDLLSEPEFAVFARLRALRKEHADSEGVPAYALFTNEQLAEMVRRRVTSVAGMREIPGVGDARVEKYGTTFVAIIRDAALPEAALAQDETKQDRTE